jgi:hypothetical protein
MVGSSIEFRMVGSSIEFRMVGSNIQFTNEIPSQEEV